MAKRTVIFSAIFVYFAVCDLNAKENNVCKTFKDYYTNRDRNKNCYFNDDADLTPVSVTYYILYNLVK